MTRLSQRVGHGTRLSGNPSGAEAYAAVFAAAVVAVAAALALVALVVWALVRLAILVGRRIRRKP